MESHLFSKDRRLNQYIHFEMLLYIHTQTTTYIYRTSKQTSPTQNAYNLAPRPHPHLTRLCGAMPQMFPHRISLHGLLTCERQKVKMLAKEQLMSYSCLFFLLKKPLNVEILSSPHKKSHEHHQSPGFKGRGRQASLSKALLTETAAG